MSLADGTADGTADGFGAFSSRISGRVQGVGFRFSARSEARRLGLTGWVRNTEDGGVEVLAEGKEECLALFATWLRKGPEGARVDGVESRRIHPSGKYLSFTVEY